MPSKKISTEVAVIGSGPGGAITGLTLAEAGFEVTIFEEGGDFPVNRYTDFSISEMKAKYRNGGVSTTLGKPGIAYVEGSCVGHAARLIGLQTEPAIRSSDDPPGDQPNQA